MNPLIERRDYNGENQLTKNLDSIDTEHDYLKSQFKSKKRSNIDYESIVTDVIHKTSIQ